MLQLHCIGSPQVTSQCLTPSRAQTPSLLTQMPYHPQANGVSIVPLLMCFLCPNETCILSNISLRIKTIGCLAEWCSLQSNLLACSQPAPWQLSVQHWMLLQAVKAHCDPWIRAAKKHRALTHGSCCAVLCVVLVCVCVVAATIEDKPFANDPTGTNVYADTK